MGSRRGQATRIAECFAATKGPFGTARVHWSNAACAGGFPSTPTHRFFTFFGNSNCLAHFRDVDYRGEYQTMHFLVRFACHGYTRVQRMREVAVLAGDAFTTASGSTRPTTGRSTPRPRRIAWRHRSGSGRCCGRQRRCCRGGASGHADVRAVCVITWHRSPQVWGVAGPGGGGGLFKSIDAVGATWTAKSLRHVCFFECWLYCIFGMIMKWHQSLCFDGGLV